ncbi:MAG TPA: tyrosine-type recombinase/integrase [Pyrinomonadaceae bacterium]|jgi:integrase
MINHKGGYIYKDEKGAWWARITVKDASGKRRNIKRRAKNETHAKELLRTIANQLDNEGEKALDSTTMTFNDLADYYAKRYLKIAEYRNERKISGLRALDRAERALKLFRQHFGAKRLRSISYGDLHAFKQSRLAKTTMHKRDRTIAGVNRELGVLRRVLNIGMREGWLTKNPFNSGDPLICASEENKRERILSHDEEKRLLAAIDAEPLRHHLKPIVLIALDCALRKGEILSLTWSDVNLDRRAITVRAFNSKTARARTVGMTTRVYVELSQLFSFQDASTSVFGLRCIRTSFVKACKKAKIDGFVFHDLRHTAITRMIRAGLPPVEVMRVSGHSTLSAFYRYANLDSDAVFRAAAALDAYHAQVAESQASEAPELLN